MGRAPLSTCPGGGHTSRTGSRLQLLGPTPEPAARAAQALHPMLLAFGGTSLFPMLPAKFRKKIARKTRSSRKGCVSRAPVGGA